MNIGEKIRSLRVAKLMTQSELAGNKITRNMLYAEHLSARCEMAKNGYRNAMPILLRMLNGEAPLDEVGLYAVLCDREICCRETEDFKGAYRYTNEKVQLLEQLLKEN